MKAFCHIMHLSLHRSQEKQNASFGNLKLILFLFSLPEGWTQTILMNPLLADVDPVYRMSLGNCIPRIALSDPIIIIYIVVTFFDGVFDFSNPRPLLPIERAWTETSLVGSNLSAHTFKVCVLRTMRVPSYSLLLWGASNYSANNIFCRIRLWLPMDSVSYCWMTT